VVAARGGGQGGAFGGGEECLNYDVTL